MLNKTSKYSKNHIIVGAHIGRHTEPINLCTHLTTIFQTSNTKIKMIDSFLQISPLSSPSSSPTPFETENKHKSITTWRSPTSHVRRVQLDVAVSDGNIWQSLKASRRTRFNSHSPPFDDRVRETRANYNLTNFSGLERDRRKECRKINILPTDITLSSQWLSFMARLLCFVYAEHIRRSN